MMTFTKLIDKNATTLFLKRFQCNGKYLHSQSKSSDADAPQQEDEFRVLNLKQVRQPYIVRKRYKKEDVLPPRANQMSPEQDWGSVWPGPRTFHPATVPLPLRHGYVPKGQAPPGKFANAELMKIPNFLHLTPPVIKRQCESLKQFCTAWPDGLETEAKQEKHFPLQVITSDYCHSSPTIRDPLARIVTIKLSLSRLPLDKHAKDKFLRLVGARHDPETDILTIVTDRCPTRKQNYEYAQFLLTALFHESWVVEPWEADKSEADMEYYDWQNNASRQTVIAIHKWNNPESQECEIPNLDNYSAAVTELINDGENASSLNKYKDAVKKMFSLPSAPHKTIQI